MTVHQVTDGSITACPHLGGACGLGEAPAHPCSPTASSSPMSSHESITRPQGSSEAGPRDSSQPRPRRSHAGNRSTPSTAGEGHGGPRVLGVPAAQPVPRTSAPCSPWPSDAPSLFEPPSSGTSFQPPGPHHTAVPEHRTIHPLLEVLPWHPYSEDKATAGASGHQAHIGPLPTPKDMPTFLLPRAPAHAAPFASSDAHPHPISS